MRTHYHYNYKYKRAPCPYCKKSIAENWWVRHLRLYHWKEMQERDAARKAAQQQPPAA